MDAVLSILFSSIVNVCPLIRTAGKDLIVFGICLLYVVVAILLAFFAVEVISVGWLMKRSCLVENVGVSQTILSLFWFYRHCIAINFLSACARKASTRASSCARLA